MAVVLGLAAALVYGAADFAGGLATKRTPALAVVVWSQLAGLVVLALAVPLVGTPLPPSGELVLGAVAGVSGGAGLALLYRGLAIGRMAVVAPITAVGAACLPVVAGLALGERPGALAFGGVAIALVAVVAVSAAPGGADGDPRRGVAEALLAGVALAGFYIVLSRVDSSAGPWPLLAARTSIPLVALAALLTRTSLAAPAARLPLIALVGVLDMGANVLYLLAAQAGLLSLVGVLVALYPASTVLLARLVLGERLARPQVAGIALAVTGAALIATG